MFGKSAKTVGRMPENLSISNYWTIPTIIILCTVIAINQFNCYMSSTMTDPEPLSNPDEAFWDII